MAISLTRLKDETSKLTDLNNLFATVFEDPQNYASQQPSAEYLSSWLSSRDHIAIIAEENNELIGGIVAYTLHKFEQERSEVYIYDLAVAQNHQRRGIGKRLVSEVCHVAKTQGASVVFVQADEGDDAIHFYESLNPIENLKTRSFDLPLGQ